MTRIYYINVTMCVRKKTGHVLTILSQKDKYDAYIETENTTNYGKCVSSVKDVFSTLCVEIKQDTQEETSIAVLNHLNRYRYWKCG